jgi:CRP/FNR family transcriptional regulator, nitrogen fixation regulation protein
MYAQLVQTDVVERIDPRGALTHSRAPGPLVKWITGVPIKFGANREIYGEKEPADYVYELTRGAVRTVKVLPDGRRQIGGFYFAGDIFGLEDELEHSFSAEAVTVSTVRLIKRSTLTRMARDDREFAEQLMTVAAQEIARLHNHALMLIKTAPERLGSFLLEMAERISLGGVIELPMSRQDIADYLGITIETVSRTFTILESQSTIALPNSRAVVLRNRSALAA